MAENPMGYERGKRVWRAQPHHAWTFDFHFKGNRYFGSTETKNKREAEQRARREYDRVVSDWHRSHPNGQNGRVRLQDMTFGRAVAAYMDARGDLDKNRKETTKHLLMLCEPEWIGANTLCSEIDMPLLHRVVAARRRQPLMSREKLATGEKPCRQVWATVDGRKIKRPFDEAVHCEDDVILLSPAYVNRSTIDLVKRVMRFVELNYSIMLTPIAWKSIRLPEADPEIVDISIDEELRLESYLMIDGYGDLVQFAILTGMRLENFTELFWSQVDFELKKITISQKGMGRRKMHTIWMDEAIEQLLKAQIGRDPRHVFVFQSRADWTNPRNGFRYEQGEFYPITYWGFVSWWRRCRKETGLTHITPHAFRRTAASRLARFTGSLIAAQKLLGHSDIRTTAKHYARFLPDDALEAQRKVRQATFERKAAMKKDITFSQACNKSDPASA